MHPCLLEEAGATWIFQKCLIGMSCELTIASIGETWQENRRPPTPPHPTPKKKSCACRGESGDIKLMGRHLADWRRVYLNMSDSAIKDKSWCWMKGVPIELWFFICIKPWAILEEVGECLALFEQRDDLKGGQHLRLSHGMCSCLCLSACSGSLL